MRSLCMALKSLEKRQDKNMTEIKLGSQSGKGVVHSPFAWTNDWTQRPRREVGGIHFTLTEPPCALQIVSYVPLDLWGACVYMPPGSGSASKCHTSVAESIQRDALLIFLFIHMCNPKYVNKTWPYLYQVVQIKLARPAVRKTDYSFWKKIK